VLSKIDGRPTIYDLVVEKNLQNKPDANRADADDRRPVADANRAEPDANWPKDVDVDVDSDGDGGGDGAGETPCAPLDERPSQRPTRKSKPTKVNGPDPQLPRTTATATPTSKPLSSAPSSAAPQMCRDCGKRPAGFMNSRWCDHCHTESPYAN
jgi:hypothetical protein